jgi:hypothetical protein
MKRVITRTSVSSAGLKVPHGELTVIWKVAAAINVRSWRAAWCLNLGSGPGSW